MKKWMIFLFFCSMAFCSFRITAYANIAPLKIGTDGVEPLENPGISIESAEVTVMTGNDGYNFNCTYTLLSLADNNALTLGIPGDMGYALEAGYIDKISVLVNGAPIECKVYNTTQNLSPAWKKYGSSLNFKWHTFTIPVKKDQKLSLSINYNMFWRIVEQNKTSPYQIVPFILSTDKLFGSIGNYKIKYINDEYISPSDVKVMINSMLDTGITSPALLSPKWDNTQILWELKDPKDFQNFRLIILSYKKLAMGFTTDTSADHSIRWAVLNNNTEGLAEIFEGIAKGSIGTSLNSEDRGTAAYLSSEFYFRIKKYDKALEMLSPSYRTILWPSSIKYEYVNAVKHKEEKNYQPLIDELTTLSSYKDYVLISSFSENEIDHAVSTLAIQAAEDSALEYRELPKNNSIAINSLKISVIILPAAALLYFILRRIIKK